MKKLNSYSLVLIAAYILTLFIMEYGTNSNWLDGLSSLSVIVLLVLFSETVSFYLKKGDRELCKALFYKDVFIINYSLVLALVASLMFQRGNVDARAWWPAAIIAVALYGLFLNILFSSLALMLKKNHSQYTNQFALVLFIAYIVFSLLPARLTQFGLIDVFNLCIILLFIGHLILCLSNQLKRFSKSWRGDYPAYPAHCH